MAKPKSRRGIVGRRPIVPGRIVPGVQRFGTMGQAPRVRRRGVCCGEEFAVWRPDALPSYRPGQQETPEPEWTSTRRDRGRSGRGQCYRRRRPHGPACSCCRRGTGRRSACSSRLPSVRFLPFLDLMSEVHLSSSCIVGAAHAVTGGLRMGSRSRRPSRFPSRSGPITLRRP